jgi:hypothetical protein
VHSLTPFCTVPHFLTLDLVTGSGGAHELRPPLLVLLPLPLPPRYPGTYHPSITAQVLRTINQHPVLDNSLIHILVPQVFLTSLFSYFLFLSSRLLILIPLPLVFHHIPSLPSLLSVCLRSFRHLYPWDLPSLWHAVDYYTSDTHHQQHSLFHPSPWPPPGICPWTN